MRLRIKKIAILLIKFFKSKIAVIAAIGIILGIGLNNKSLASSDNYNFATCFQYYMLDNRADSVKKQGNNEKLAFVAPIGSGGVSGSFSYNDIVNSAPNEDAKKIAEKFVSMMATYSTFKYFSNRVQGFESIGPYIGRFTLMILLLPLAILMDLVQLLIPAILKLLATLNVIPLLGAALTNLSIQTGLTEALGLSKDDINNFMNAFLAIAISFLLISLFLTLKNGSRNIDKTHWRKFKGRLFTMICFPLVIGLSATIINEVSDKTTKVPALNNTFSRYLIDDRSWAYNYNFAPLGNDNSGTDIKGNSGSFVDLSFDPYASGDKGEKRIGRINADSSLAGNGAIFPNSSLLMAYGMSQAFSATDYINYEGSEQSLHLLGSNSKNQNSAYGSYNSYANSFSAKDILDTDNAFFPSGGKSGIKDDQKGSYASAINDYKAEKGTLNTSKVTAWRDRFIYGAKNSGDLDKYYGETPSQEMVKNQVGGTETANVPSDQSMFLILSTIFDETGGRYFISAPARGIKASIPSFDSNRSDYYVVSMVGNPFFTIIGLLTGPLMVLVVLVALLVAVFSIGLLDMNIKPFAAAVKGLTLGDIEYPEAFLFYSLGIAGTLIAFYAVPPLLIEFISHVSQLIVKGVPIAAGMQPQSAQASLAFNGVRLVVQGFTSVFMAVLWWKSMKFRNILNDFFCFPWNWASEAARHLEEQAQKGSLVSSGQIKTKNRQVNNRMNRQVSRVQDGLKRVALSTLSDKVPHIPTPTGSPTNGHKKSPVKTEHEPEDDLPIREQKEDGSTLPTNGKGKSTKPKTPAQIKRNGKFERIGKGLSELQTDPKTSRQIVDNVLDSQQAIDNFRADPSEHNFEIARKRLEQLKQAMIAGNAPKNKIAKVDKAIRELDGLGKSYGIDTKKFENSKPAVSKHSEEKDNDDAKVEKKQDELSKADQNKKVKNNDDSEVVKPKSDKPVESTHKDSKKAKVNSSKSKSSNLDQEHVNADNKELPNNEKSSDIKTVTKKVNASKPVTSSNQTDDNAKAELEDKLKQMAKSKEVKPKATEAKSDYSKNITLDKTGKTQTNNPVKSTNDTSTVQTRESNSNHSPVNSNRRGKHITQTVKSTTHQTMESQKDKDIINKIVEHKNVINSRKSDNNVKPIVKRSTKTISSSKTLKGKTHRPVINVTDTRELKREIRENFVKPTINHKSNYVTSNQLKGVRSALGTIANDPRIEKPLTQLRESSNLSEVKRNIRALQKSVKALDSNTKKQINKENLVNNLFDLQNSHKFGEK